MDVVDPPLSLSLSLSLSPEFPRPPLLSTCESERIVQAEAAG